MTHPPHVRNFTEVSIDVTKATHSPSEINSVGGQSSEMKCDTIISYCSVVQLVYYPDTYIHEDVKRKTAMMNDNIYFIASFILDMRS
jgi:hypothetical protein